MEYWTAQSEMKDLMIWFLLGCLNPALCRISLWEGLFLGGHCHPKTLTKGGSGSLIPTWNLKLLRKHIILRLTFLSWGIENCVFAWIFMKIGDEFRFLEARFQGSSLIFCESEWAGNWLAVEWLGSHGTFQVRDSSTCSRDAFMWFPREIVTPYNIFTREPMSKCLVAKLHCFSLQTHLSS